MGGARVFLRSFSTRLKRNGNCGEIGNGNGHCNGNGENGEAASKSNLALAENVDILRYVGAGSASYGAVVGGIRLMRISGLAYYKVSCLLPVYEDNVWGDLQSPHTFGGPPSFRPPLGALVDSLHEEKARQLVKAMAPLILVAMVDSLHEEKARQLVKAMAPQRGRRH
ncbi:hypothetical protein OROGR_011999 [Orobanche gracilis]